MKTRPQLFPLSLWLGVASLGIIVRLWLWWNSIGSNDVYLWASYAQQILDVGLAGTYKAQRAFNHPPLMGIYVSHAWRWSGFSLLNFARLLKIPGLIGEGVTLWTLWKFAGPRVFAAYACLPAAILVSGYHGNTDPLCAALVLVAAISFDRNHYFTSGLLWAGALNVKLMPLILLPIPMLASTNWRSRTRLCLGLLAGLLPFLPPAVTALGAMCRNLLAYAPNLDNWGIPALLNAAAQIPKLKPQALSMELWYAAYGRYIIIIAVLSITAFSVFRRKMTVTEQCAVGAALFLMLASGFGLQYVIFIAPLLCLVDLSHGLWWGWISGLFVGVVYWIFLSWDPLRSFLLGFYPGPAPLIGMLAWAVLANFVWARLRFPRYSCGLRSDETGNNAITMPVVSKQV